MSGHPGPTPRGGKAETTPTRIVLKKGGTFFLNGALIRAHDAFGAEIHLAEALLLPSQILSAEAARTPLQRLYYCVQQALIEPEAAATWREAFTAGLPPVLDPHSTVGPVQRDSLERVAALVEAGRLIEALAALRRAIKAGPAT
ncbi:flagellar biosynthesis repressor FlbT [Methylobacterium sp. SyP6R]|uniref:flagellar biosynthesis repressor FlbT n=1 Tax=Methylobacterium sp. SyP6R TaxID=2718876 RepID=UPI001F325F2E|nr:flagellar biosynthesis repressor FlbT [Methylobacterium sp. SyP6R]MCF4129174.1 flagellar biosynthesis repressor FlbT [Methylobacterium sp. SyP6R]